MISHFPSGPKAHQQHSPGQRPGYGVEKGRALKGRDNASTDNCVIAKVGISNGLDPAAEPLEIDAVVNASANWTCISEQLRARLDLIEIDQREFTDANGRTRKIPYVGPLMLRFKTRLSIGGALIIGGHLSLGNMAMLDLDVLIDPGEKKLIINPEHPDRAGGFLLGVFSSVAL